MERQGLVYISQARLSIYILILASEIESKRMSPNFIGGEYSLSSRGVIKNNNKEEGDEMEKWRAIGCILVVLGIIRVIYQVMTAQIILGKILIGVFVSILGILYCILELRNGTMHSLSQVSSFLQNSSLEC